MKTLHLSIIIFVSIIAGFLLLGNHQIEAKCATDVHGKVIGFCAYPGGKPIAEDASVPPLKQFRDGIVMHNITCRESFVLIVKIENNSPSCVTQQTANILFERGWTKTVIPVTSYTESDNQHDKVVDLPSGLQLSLYVGPKTIHTGQSIVIDLFLRNTLSKPLVVPVKNDWAIKAVGLESCTPNPAALSILQGYYTKDNMTKGKLLWFSDPFVTCPAVAYNIENFQFDPLSSHAKSVGCTSFSNEPICNINTSKHVSTKGYWTIENGFHLFEPENYTVIGLEQSGYAVIQHFTVVNSTSR